jgi:hypothetical protein
MPLPEQIQNTEDIRAFITYLVMEECLNFHPDTPFTDYICYTSNKPTYTSEECQQRENLLDQCFTLAGDEVYEIGEEIQRANITLWSGETACTAQSNR